MLVWPPYSGGQRTRLSNVKQLHELDEERDSQELQSHTGQIPALKVQIVGLMEQYQHYIPQLLLRNFSHTYKAPPEKRSKKVGKHHYEKGKHPGDKVLNVVDLTAEKSRLLESPVSRWFGQEDMYKDFADAIKSKKEVEKELSKLECWTAEILQKIKKAHENREPGIWLTRVERNRLWKFLFIMKYRGPSFHEKYMSEDPQLYESEDKHLLRAYMADTGMVRPKDVWLHNLRSIPDLDMDAEGKWMTQLPTLMSPADAEMFVVHANFSYMAFCTPTAKNAEFLLTDQCYNVFEGLNHETFCARTGEHLGNTHLCYHEFGPVSPRLIIVLRSMILPEALEDANPSIRISRQTMIDAVATQFPDPKNVKSILSDLPVAKATNSFTRVLNGRLELAPGASGTPRRTDKFHFRFWPISTEHVDIINSIFLDNLLHCKSVVCGSTGAFKRTLEAYMSMPASAFKVTGTGEYGTRDSRLACLRRLSTVLEMLGSETVPIWFATYEPSREPLAQSFDDVWLEMTKKILGDGDESISESTEEEEEEEEEKKKKKKKKKKPWPALPKIHVLGGSRKSFVNDLDQSWRLYKLQALVYTLTTNLDPDLQRKARMNVLNLIHRTHPRRVWLYVEHRRWMLSDEYAMHQEIYVGSAPLYAAKTEAMFRAGQEDEVAKAKPTTDQQLLSALIYAAGVFQAT